MKKRLRSLAVLFIGSITFLGAATPDAGQLLREQQSQVERKPVQRLPESDAPVVTHPAPTPTGATVLVKGFRFSGYEGIATESELQAVVIDSVGKTAGLSDLQALADRVTAAFRLKGYFLARAYLPKQDVTSGIIEISVVQARSDGNVTIHREEGVRLHEQQLQRMVDALITPGQPLHEYDLERALLLMNDLPGITARAVLEPGSAPGTTRITINASEAKLFSGSVWADNYGNRYTGAWRGNGAISVNDPFGMGDQFSVMFSGAEGLAQGRVAYSVPIGGRGLRGDVSYTAMQYELLGALAALDAKGSARTFEASIVYPLIRRRTFTLNLNAGYNFKTLLDKAFGFSIRDKLIHGGTAGVSGERSDGLGGGGYTSWSALISGGNLDLSNNAADEAADRAGPRTSGGYTRFNLSASRLQRITAGLMLSASYFGQFAPDNLDSSEKFSLGGAYGVRAYPVGEASGDEGHLFNVELRQELPLGLKWGAVQVIGFADTGHITLNKSQWPGSVPTATGENGYWLSGAGLGFGVSHPGRYSVRVNYARKLGDNPGRSVTGMDADGRNSAGRVWAMAQFAF